MKRFFLAVIFLAAFSAYADSPSIGQVISVPIYSHIYTGDNQKEFQLTATAIFRNIDQRNPITIISADYYNSAGKRVKRYVSSPVTVPPFSAVKYVINESDTAGGSGASLVITWKAARPIVAPVAGAVMIGAKSQQGISFTSQGTVVKELGQ